jgi:hypothetical protein
MYQLNSQLFTQFYQLFIFECSSIISNQSFGTAKSGEYIFLQKVYDDSVIGIPGGNSLNPLRKVIGGNQNPPMLSTRRWMDFSYEVQAPLLKRPGDYYRLDR